MLKLALGFIILNIFSTFNNVNPIFHIDVDDSVVTKYYSFSSIPTPQDSNLGIGEFIERVDKGMASAS